MDQSVQTEVRIVEHRRDLLGEKESLYVRKPLIMHEEKDLSYFGFVAQNEGRKGVAGLFGCRGAGKTSLARMIGRAGVVRGSSDAFPTETSYERKREATIHVHPSVVFLQKRSGMTAILTLLDTSGHMDFMSETLDALQSIDIAAVVLDVQGTLSIQHSMLFEAIRTANKPVVVVMNKADGAGSLAERVRHFRDRVRDILKPTAFFLASTRLERIVSIEESLDGLDDAFDKCSGISDDFVNCLLDETIFRHRQVEEGVSYNPRTFSCGSPGSEAVGFLIIGGAMFCSLVPSRVLRAGCSVAIGHTMLVVEKIYIPFLGCLVDSETAFSRVGAVVRFYPDAMHRIPRRMNVAQLLRSAVGSLECGVLSEDTQRPCMRAAISPRIRAEFDQRILLLTLVYRDLVVEECIVMGTGELFLDAALHDLRSDLGVQFEVLSVSSDLRIDTGGDLDIKNANDVPDAILEPFYLTEIVYMPDAEEIVNELVGGCRGRVLSREDVPLSMGKRMVAHVPVVESFGFETDLRVYSCSLADCCKVLSHWDALRESGRICSLVEFVRRAGKR